jgi:hypothetical protein
MAGGRPEQARDTWAFASPGSTGHAKVERTRILARETKLQAHVGRLWGGGGQCTLAIIAAEWMPRCPGLNSSSSWETSRSEEVHLYKVLRSHPIKQSGLRNAVGMFAQCSLARSQRHTRTQKTSTICVYSVP